MENKRKPNLIYILTDDMGYGDVSRFNPDCGFQTSAIDQLCEEGMRFTDAHATSAVCTPSRYSILTGRYCWRSALKKDVLQGYDMPIIEEGRNTVADYLKSQGYATACIGKWHLGIQFTLKDESDKYSADFSKPLLKGPVDFGFDYFYGIASSLDMPPYVYIENDRIDGLPNRETASWWDKGNSYNKQMFRKGPTGCNFRHEEVLPKLTEKALSYIEENRERPFFLYLALTAPHTPILPTKEFLGKSGTTEYGDFVLMCDDVVAQINRKLEALGLSENSILVFTSDNGCSPRANYPELAQYGHNPSWILRGTKFDIFEGGHRVPLVIKWKGHIKENTVCDETVCLMDLYATMADLLKTPPDDHDAVDSVSNLPLWLGEDLCLQEQRKALIHHSVNGSFSVRMGNWKLILCPDSGGKSDPVPGDTPSHFPPMQLYRMDTDIRERYNCVSLDQCPEIVSEMQAFLEQSIARGRTTMGEPLDNTEEVIFESQIYGS